MVAFVPLRTLSVLCRGSLPAGFYLDLPRCGRRLAAKSGGFRLSRMARNLLSTFRHQCVTLKLVLATLRREARVSVARHLDRAALRAWQRLTRLNISCSRLMRRIKKTARIYPVDHEFFEAGVHGRDEFNNGTRPEYASALLSLIAEELMREIRTGRFPPGILIPTEPELCKRFCVSRVTVRGALRNSKCAG